VETVQHNALPTWKDELGVHRRDVILDQEFDPWLN
jgi:hypothetical protein